MKKLPSAKLPLPKFHSDKEAAEYFDTHFVADIWDQLPPAKPAKMSAALSRSIHERHSAAKSPISIRLIPEQIAAARKSPPRNRSVIKRNCGCGLPTEFSARPKVLGLRRVAGREMSLKPLS